MKLRALFVPIYLIGIDLLLLACTDRSILIGCVGQTISYYPFAAGTTFTDRDTLDRLPVAGTGLDESPHNCGEMITLLSRQLHSFGLVDSGRLPSIPTLRELAVAEKNLLDAQQLRARNEHDLEISWKAAVTQQPLPTPELGGSKEEILKNEFKKFLVATLRRPPTFRAAMKKRFDTPFVPSNEVERKNKALQDKADILTWFKWSTQKKSTETKSTPATPVIELTPTDFDGIQLFATEQAQGRALDACKAVPDCKSYVDARDLINSQSVIGIALVDRRSGTTGGRISAYFSPSGTDQTSIIDPKSKQKEYHPIYSTQITAALVSILSSYYPTYDWEIVTKRNEISSRLMSTLQRTGTQEVGGAFPPGVSYTMSLAPPTERKLQDDATATESSIVTKNGPDVQTGTITPTCALQKLVYRLFSDTNPDECLYSGAWSNTAAPKLICVAEAVHRSDTVVSVHDNAGNSRPYGSSQLVPSCLACQALLPSQISNRRPTVTRPSGVVSGPTVTGGGRGKVETKTTPPPGPGLRPSGVSALVRPPTSTPGQTTGSGSTTISKSPAKSSLTTGPRDLRLTHQQQPNNILQPNME